MRECERRAHAVKYQSESSRCWGIYGTGKNQNRRRKVFLYGVSVLLLLVIQKVLGKIGGKVVDLAPYGAFDPYDAYAGVSVHHIVEALIAVVLILFLSRLWKVDSVLI